ncbi:hypothetical protein LOH54_06900 [Sulfurimonas sp. HSL-3221]|uniref:hypothetical protein n=1 Tax=Sulfurimonadaceae TaxID=2771471 RepID=UPI001E3496EA|nr:hypothetical protein [Sulfurimonas sp. HSL-3221]UFS61387.1 hypothetical protein LOH54_06900 [Sulfurimonas sp. HSL-3221]
MKTLLLTLLLLPVLLFARSGIVSGVPLPKTYVLNLDPYECDTDCLEDLVDHEQFFSLLAQMPEPIEDEELNEQRLIYVALFNIDGAVIGTGVRFALLLPERVIGRYAASTTNSVLAYLLGKNRDFELKTFNIGTESPDDIRAGLSAVSQEHFHYVIAPFTKKGAETLVQLRPRCNVYLPTVNIADVNATELEEDDGHFYFGGIDYRAQIGKLVENATPPLVIFYDQSALGEELKNAAESAYMERFSDDDPLSYEAAGRAVYAYPIDKRTTNLKHILDQNERLQHGTFLLNTPLIKSAMIMSQLTLYDANATQVLATQIGYNSMLFDITQPQDREHMLVANSIGKQNGVLVESNKLLQNDIEYDWINYATTLGVDYFYSLAAGTPREYTIPIEDHQVAYPVTLYRAGISKFALLDEEEEDEGSLFE